MTTLALPRALDRALVVWRFSRPHTAIGTTLGVAGLFAVAAHTLPGVEPGPAVFHGVCTLLAALAVNVFIVGVNQVTDIDIDRVNKPYLPLAAGELTPRRAQAIVTGAAFLALGMAISQGPVETSAVVAALAIGAAYSVEPVRLKRFPVLASASISLVRALVVNLGVYLHFSLAFTGQATVHPAVWALTAFTVPFSVAIAILKDVPDVEGDRRYRIATFSVRFGREPMTRVGLGLLYAAYAGIALAGPFIPGISPPLWIAGHLGAAAVLWRWAADRREFERFYMRVWQLFFTEYGLVAAAVLLSP